MTPAELRTFLVIGIYADDHQRWADSFTAASAEAAEAMAPEGVIVAGVVELQGTRMMVVG